MAPKKQFAYIDEAGNSDLDLSKEGVSSHFIVTAIIVDEEGLPKFIEQISALRIKHFQEGEIRSKKVGKDDGRRMKILIDMQSLDFHIFSVLVDKSILISKGFDYKTSFYKFLPNLIYEELFKAYPSLQITVDEHGSTDFMDSLIKYVRKKNIPDSLFSTSDFGVVNSKLSEQVQLADFIAGTIARSIELDISSDQSKAFFALLKAKTIDIKVWPQEDDSYLADTSSIQDPNKALITDVALHLITRFISENSSRRKPQINDQVNYLRYLLYYFKFINPHKYISTIEILKHLEHTSGRVINVYYFRTKVIANLRDKGIIIASSSKGYKIPASQKDLYDFLNHDNSIIQPMLRRIKLCRDRILLASKNNLDILDDDAYKSLKTFFERTQQ